MENLKALIVDDNRDFAESMADALELHHHSVEVAFSGEEAIKKFKGYDFDITFLDINLPGMNGSETCLGIRKLKPDARVVMMTAYRSEQLLASSIDNGAWAILRKPFKMKQLLEMVHSVGSEVIVLIADDDRDFVESFKELLENTTYTVLPAYNGTEAIELAKSQKIDLLILDLRLPDLSGYEIYSELTRTGIYVPTIIITAYQNEEATLIGSFQDLSVDSVISKPFDPKVLRDMIDKTLKKGVKKFHLNDFHPVGVSHKLLVVDADMDFADSVADILVCRGYEVEVARNANEALGIIRSSDIPVILVDIGMKYSGGINLISKFHEIRSGIRCVIMTSGVTTENAMDMVLDGAYSYIKKPFNVKELILLIDQCLKMVSLEYEKSVAEENLKAQKIEFDSMRLRLSAVVRTTKGLVYGNQFTLPGPGFLESLAWNLNAHGGSVFHKEKDRLVLIHTLDSDHVPPTLSFPLKKGSVMERAMDERYPFLIRDICSDATPSGWNGYKNDSALIFPILNDRGETSYIITLHNKITEGFTPLDLQLASILFFFMVKTLAVNDKGDNKQTNEDFSMNRLSPMACLYEGIAHKLHQPLSSISLYAETLKNMAIREKTLDSGHVIDFLDKILKQTDRNAFLIDQIKDFASTANTSEIHRINLKETIFDVLELFYSQIKCLGVDLRMDVQPNLYIKANKVLLKQVIVNLLSNAQESFCEKSNPSDNEKIKKEIIVKCRAEDDGTILDVIDSGSGVNKDIEKSIFEPFITSKKEKGKLGMGLTACSKILEDYNASIKLLSTSANGSTFRVRFPGKVDDNDL